jgi:tetratricopeptide (TPR) repeat protein
MGAKQPEFALRLLENMVDKDDSSAAFDLVLGNLYFELQRVADAEARYRRAIEKYPDFRRAWENLGVLYYSSDRPAEAVPCLSKVVALGGWDPRLLGLLAWCLAHSDNAMAAELAYMQAAILEPNNPDWIEGLLHIVLETGQYARAESLLERLTRLKPRDARPWEMLANVFIAQQRHLDAIVTLETTAGLGVLTPRGLEQLGDLYVNASLSREAIRTYERLAALDPAAGTDRMLRHARALVDTGDLKAAEPLLDKLAATVAGEQRIAWLHLRAQCRSARGDLAGAQQELETLLASDPLNGRALLRLAEIQTAQGDELRAAFTLESAAPIPEVAFAANVQLAQLKVRRRDYGQALALLENALKLEDSPVVREYRARVAALVDRRE